ncbi:unnamed protein product [Arabis nemorensis]|uniref:BED-type domain-containing protein n=1 Tax=Arabis nemorensis TaxID=586526 RepID=A0A565BS09_9BRAS|nr:unnamed protein product [Arabis nemorensis]
MSSNKKLDLVRKYAIDDPTKTSAWKCSFCAKITNGGVQRAKQHLVGGFRNVTEFSKVPDHVKQEIKGFMLQKAEIKATT